MLNYILTIYLLSLSLLTSEINVELTECNLSFYFINSLDEVQPDHELDEPIVKSTDSFSSLAGILYKEHFFDSLFLLSYTPTDNFHSRAPPKSL